MSPLVTRLFWAQLLERLGRQAAQTAAPMLVLIVSSGGVVDVRTVGLAMAGVLAVTLVAAALRGLADVHATADTALGWQLLDRAVPAAAGVFAGLWPTTAEGLLVFDARSASVAAASAALLAVLAYFMTPPAILVPVSPSADGSFDVSTLPRQGDGPVLDSDQVASR